MQSKFRLPLRIIVMPEIEFKDHSGLKLLIRLGSFVKNYR